MKWLKVCNSENHVNLRAVEFLSKDWKLIFNSLGVADWPGGNSRIALFLIYKMELITNSSLTALGMWRR